MSKIAYGYVRVSTSEQADSGLSIEAQRERMKGIPIIRPDVQLKGVYEDAGESASTLQRPQLKNLLDLCAEGQAQMVCVTKLDRLTRSVRDLYDLLDFFDAHNVTLISLSEGLDTTSATGRLVVGIIAGVSQWERETVSERTKETLSHLKRESKRYGQVPFGYKADDDGNILPNLEEQDIYNRAVSLQMEQYSYRQIAEALTAQGMLNRRGKPFSKQSIFKMLKEGERNWTPTLV